MSSYRAVFRLILLRALACAIPLILFTNCGFQPLYGTPSGQKRAGTVADMSYVAAATIPDRSGQLVRNQLLDRLHPLGAAKRPLFRLQVKLDESREGVAFEQDDSATRFNLRLSAQFELIDTRKGVSLLKGHTRAIAAYNVVRSDYANLISQRDALQRAADSLADSIQRQIVIYFQRLKG